jgi:diguanylate cyclase (GGDEF)-like protein
MTVRNAFERRIEADDELIARFAVPGRMSRPQAWAVTLAGLGLTAFGNVLTDAAVWFGPFYLVCIGYAAWSLGWRPALGVGLLSIASVLSINGLNLYPYGTIAALWNLGMRIVAVLMYIGLLDHARNSYAREWRLARTDPLTGALNRQAFFELAGAATSARGWRLLAYADLDGLKRLNDRSGHAVGDTCLKDYVRHVRTVIRKYDVFARIGGDEFVIYMRVRDEAAAKIVATRLHCEMNTIAARIDGDLRCSVGVLILPPGQRLIDREVRMADQLMYEAKQRGADLAAATLREVRGRLYILRHWEMSQVVAPDQPGEQDLRVPETGELPAAA